MELAFIIRVHAVGLDFPDTRRPRMLQETGATERERPAGGIGRPTRGAGRGGDRRASPAALSPPL